MGFSAALCGIVKSLGPLRVHGHSAPLAVTIKAGIEPVVRKHDGDNHREKYPEENQASTSARIKAVSEISRATDIEM
jgi:hypothetical protein